MWVLKSRLSKEVVAGPFQFQAEMAKKLGVSQQYVNRQIKQNKVCFNLDGQKVYACKFPTFMAGKKKIQKKEDIGEFLGVPQEVVDKVFRKHTSGIIQTPQGEVKIQKRKPGKKPTLPAVRVFVG